MAVDLLSLAGRVALITGANSGIGLALARAFHEAGASVAVCGRRTARNEAIAAQLGEPAEPVTLDVCDEDSVRRAMEHAVARFGRLDVLVNNAGISQRASVMELDRATWQRVLDTDLTGAFLCTKYAARQMRDHGAGKIINVASIYGLVAPSKGLQVAYAVAKHGLIGLTRVNAVELAAWNIQVNAVAPGWYFTEMTEELRGTHFQHAVERRTPAGRWGQTSDLVGTVRFLASAASGFVSGAVIPVDGGFMASDGIEQ
jgi:2-dehydro-3-deoxy-D-gluconate 5-dehydrogenase